MTPAPDPKIGAKKTAEQVAHDAVEQVAHIAEAFRRFRESAYNFYCSVHNAYTTHVQPPLQTLAGHWQIHVADSML